MLKMRLVNFFFLKKSIENKTLEKLVDLRKNYIPITWGIRTNTQEILLCGRNWRVKWQFYTAFVQK